MLQTYTVGHHTLMGMLHYHWTFDTSRFSLERERLQMPAVLLFLAFTGARPGAAVESVAYRGTNQALLYRDLKLKLLQPPGGSSLLVLEVTIRLDKGKRKRPAPKTITLYENRQCPAMCPILHFLGLAFADNAFHASLMEQGLTPSKLHRFQSPEGRITIEFKFREDILEVPVFRAWHSLREGVEIHPTRALSASVINQESKRLGRLAGLSHDFRPYCLRREVGTELTGITETVLVDLVLLIESDRGVSEQQRNQIMGHARSETFLKHYLSSSVVVDVQAAFLGLESRSDLIKEMGKLRLRRDPNLPKELSGAQKKIAHQEPDLIDAQKEHNNLYIELKSRYGQLQKAPLDCTVRHRHKELAQTIRKLKLQYERVALQKLLENFHSNADLDHMVMQLKGEAPVTQATLPPLQHSLPDREWLANKLFSPADDDTFAQIVESMARICPFVEPVKVSSKQKVTTPEVYDCSEQCVTGLTEALIQPPTLLDLQPGVQNLASTVEPATANTSTKQSSPTVQLLSRPGVASRTPRTVLGKRHAKEQPDLTILPRKTPCLAGPTPSLPRSVCLFCYREDIKNHVFKRKDHLRRHYRTTHFQYEVGAFLCPIPSCRTLIQDPDHFSAHATSMHHSDLGVRASIMQAKSYKVRPGQLQSFRL